jgi:hypothetical protein
MFDAVARLIRVVFAITFCIGLLAAIVGLIGIGRPLSIGFSADYRGKDGIDDYFYGTRSYHVVACGSRIGLVTIIHVFTGSETPVGTDIAPRQPVQFLWHDLSPLRHPDRFSEMLYSRFGFSEYIDHSWSTGDHEDTWTYTANTWVVALLFTAPSALLIWLSPGRRKLKPGFCQKCSYDIRTQLTGHAGAACPECGTPVGHGPAPA